MQYQQAGHQQQQQHPLLSAISGNNYAETQRAHYPWTHQQQQVYQNPYLHHGRPLLGAASNHNGAYVSTGSGHSGYGIEPSVEYELHQTAPSGSYSSYHPSEGSAPAYPPHPPHPPHPPQYHAPKSAPTTPGSKKKKSAGSVMSALTLLSFFFFVNMLQSCIKEHIADINPTVMVLTSSGSRNRFNKLAEMNSREQTSSPASTTASESAAASWQQPALAPVSSSAVVPVIVTPGVTLHTPYSSGLVTNKPASHSTHSYEYHQQSPPHQHQHQQQHHHHHHPDADDNDYNYGQRPPYTAAAPSSVADFYPNRTHIDQSLRPDSDYYQHPYYPERVGNRHQHQHHYMDSGYPWSYGANSNSHSQSPSHSHGAGSKRYSSSASLGAQSGVSSYLDNARYRQDDYDHRSNINVHHYEDDADDDDGDGNGDGADQSHLRRRSGDAFYTRNTSN